MRLKFLTIAFLWTSKNAMQIRLDQKQYVLNLHVVMISVLSSRAYLLIEPIIIIARKWEYLVKQSVMAHIASFRFKQFDHEVHYIFPLTLWYGKVL